MLHLALLVVVVAVQQSLVVSCHRVATALSLFWTSPTEKSAPEEAIKRGVTPGANVTMKKGPQGTKINTPAATTAPTASSTPKTTSPTPAAPQHSTKSTFAPVLTPASFPTSQAPAHVPQYRFVTPIENETTTIEIAKRALEAQVTLTTGELYAVAPDVRKFVKDRITTRRVPTSTMLNEADTTATDILAVDPAEAGEIFNLAALSTLRDSKTIVAKPVESLRTVEIFLDGRMKVNAILDDGSQIIAVSREVWERLGIPLRSDRIMTMEAANKSRNDSMGLLQDLRVRIGDVDLYLQIQVLDNASYDVLLGRPFHSLTRAQIQHEMDGDASVVIHDPNSAKVVVLPMKERVRKREAGVSVVEVGF
ncbi:hypothetical protein D9611_010061 [Ephemerocybe angulata]|uniref:Uncharacterized protein n=1 Tax=Ephemerocybe angulata TaxID=980116 RepID=A0A8H5AZQ9_9AGAR|nr:hypothetical protein D9611_010061 [Tulosesus angulatus]